jgi:hypothetical protein
MQDDGGGALVTILKLTSKLLCEIERAAPQFRERALPHGCGSIARSNTEKAAPAWQFERPDVNMATTFKFCHPYPCIYVVHSAPSSRTIAAAAVHRVDVIRALHGVPAAPKLMGEHDRLGPARPSKTTITTESSHG